jgi:hypothetical protein
MPNQASKNRYWKIVTDSLVELFGITTAAAGRKVDSLRPEVSESFYHTEPLNVAYELSGKAGLNLRDFIDRYEQIVQRYYGVTETPAKTSAAQKVTAGRSGVLSFGKKTTRRNAKTPSKTQVRRKFSGEK